MHPSLSARRLLFLATCWVGIAGIALAHVSAASAQWGEQGVVFVAPGAGDFRSIEENMRDVVAWARLPLRVELVDWSIGLLCDVTDRANHRKAGWRLAQRILHYRQVNPTGKVYLVSHSAGGAILLAAADFLPPGSVDRIILLAPGVSCDYDLCRALRVSRHGIDLFYSDRDAVLGFAVETVGTTEKHGVQAAGQVGFTPVVATPADAQLYAGLRQHPWRPECEALGYYGGHFGLIRPLFLSRRVLPMMTR